MVGLRARIEDGGDLEILVIAEAKLLQCGDLPRKGIYNLAFKPTFDIFVRAEDLLRERKKEKEIIVINDEPLRHTDMGIFNMKDVRDGKFYNPVKTGVLLSSRSEWCFRRVVDTNTFSLNEKWTKNAARDQQPHPQRVGPAADIAGELDIDGELTHGNTTAENFGTLNVKEMENWFDTNKDAIEEDIRRTSLHKSEEGSVFTTLQSNFFAYVMQLLNSGNTFRSPFVRKYKERKSSKPSRLFRFRLRCKKYRKTKLSKTPICKCQLVSPIKSRWYMGSLLRATAQP